MVLAMKFSVILRICIEFTTLRRYNLVMHILFIRFSSLGDVILNSSLFGLIKNASHRDVHLSLLTSEQFAPLMQAHEDIDNVYGFSRGHRLGALYDFVKKIDQDRKIDLIIDMHGTLRSLFIRFAFFKIPRVFVDKRTIERWLLTTFKIDLLSWQNNQVDQRKPGHGELLLKRNPRDFFFLFGADEKKLIDYQDSDGRLSACSITYKDLEKSVDPYVVIVPSASFPEKRWSAENFKSLCEKFLEKVKDIKLYITAGPEDKFCEIFNPLANEYPDRFFNYQGKTNLPETIELVAGASLVIGNDTGVPHFSESVGTPCLFILGPTGEQFGFYPHLRMSRVISKDIWCRPCTTNGKGNCIRSQRFCLTDISVDEVYENAVEMLNEIK